ncbi:hypothetical protein C5E45_27600 [Nocardia nova]|uniref:Uncharacterized protein n=1 Tax=Nocardia nova TaxID=37330 RepID=A0A2S6AIG6_9NOCA|nr:hypothetical protein [Nocardia nova]PPJ23696.1 hypothetical protein C5E41_23825 [Nocardia nova]PPJ35015.1 hypothetical protein C5E45_27600 [Nocardia nova]
MHRLEKSALWRCVLNGLSALGAGFGAMVPVCLNECQVDDYRDAEAAEAEWDWSIPYRWCDHAHG